MSTIATLLAPENVAAAWDKVRRNDGAPGVDGVTVREIGRDFGARWQPVAAAIHDGTYRPRPVRCVDIPKLGGGTRTLGIPTVLDRVVQQLLVQRLAPQWEPSFSPQSYAYRPGRSARQAVAAAQAHLGGPYPWAVHLDIEKFFDRLHHGSLHELLRAREADPAVLRLIALTLEAGAMAHGVAQPTWEGIPQGSPLSPLLANIALDLLDRRLDAHSIPFVRYADDCLLLAPDHDTARRLLEAARTFLRQRLQLSLNEAKTSVQPANHVNFLGFSFERAETGTLRCVISPGAETAFLQTLGAQTSFLTRPDPEAQLTQIGIWVQGWMAYFGSAQDAAQIARLWTAVLTAARAMLWRSWGDTPRRRRELAARGLSTPAIELLISTCHNAEDAARHPSLIAATPAETFAPHRLLPPSPAGSTGYHRSAPAPRRGIPQRPHPRPHFTPLHALPPRLRPWLRTAGEVARLILRQFRFNVHLGPARSRGRSRH